MLNAGASGDVQALAEGIVKGQAAEVAEMQEWRERWYPDVPAASSGDPDHEMSHHDIGGHDHQ